MTSEQGLHKIDQDVAKRTSSVVFLRLFMLSDVECSSNSYNIMIVGCLDLSDMGFTNDARIKPSGGSH